MVNIGVELKPRIGYVRTHTAKKQLYDADDKISILRYDGASVVLLQFCSFDGHSRVCVVRATTCAESYHAYARYNTP